VDSRHPPLARHALVDPHDGFVKRRSLAGSGLGRVSLAVAARSLEAQCIGTPALVACDALAMATGARHRYSDGGDSQADYERPEGLVGGVGIKQQ
jgi:hypothetical protein